MQSHNPEEPFHVHGRDLVPLRQHSGRFSNHRRERLFAAEDDLRARIAELDQILVDATTERHRLLEEITRLHDELRPCYRGARGRRARAVNHEEPLPPIAERPTWLTGRALRAICLAFIRRAIGPLTLRQLHVLLHRAGYAIASAVPVKTLADALGHEVDVGRAVRVARGTYARTATGPRPQAARPDDGEGPSTLPDW